MTEAEAVALVGKMHTDTLQAKLDSGAYLPGSSYEQATRIVLRMRYREHRDFAPWLEDELRHNREEAKQAQRFQGEAAARARRSAQEAERRRQSAIRAEQSAKEADRLRIEALREHQRRVVAERREREQQIAAEEYQRRQQREEQWAKNKAAWIRGQQEHPELVADLLRLQAEEATLERRVAELDNNIRARSFELNTHYHPSMIAERVLMKDERHLEELQGQLRALRLQRSQRERTLQSLVDKE